MRPRRSAAEAWSTYYAGDGPAARSGVFAEDAQLRLGVLKQYADQIKGQLFDVDALHKAIDAIYQYPLRHAAIGCLVRFATP